jgi:hypothetical protein
MKQFLFERLAETLMQLICLGMLLLVLLAICVLLEGAIEVLLSAIN